MSETTSPTSRGKQAFVPGSPQSATNCASSTRPAIHQIYYEDGQIAYLDKDFIPYRNVANPRPEWCEYFVFRTEYLKGTCSHGLTGFLSWKFGQKTGLSGRDFHSWIANYPGYDVYFVNPFPKFVRKRFRSVWHQGSICHRDLLPIAQLLFDKVGYRLNIEALAMDERVTAYCNYWVATPEFWRRYMEFCEPLYDVVENGLTPNQKDRILARADSVSNCCYIPYIFERLFSTLLCIDHDIRALRMPLPNNVDGKYMEPPLYIRIIREICRPYKRMKERRTRELNAAS